ncbi:MAG TPA: trigger factor, partial [Geobacteraceae bacterium]|nr:trigger factor [Geobacteraceae bacterium]
IRVLVEKNDFELPDAMVDRQLASMLENTKQRLQYQNLSLEMMGLDEARYKEQFRTVAENQVKGALLLHELAEKVGTEVSESDVEARLRRISEESGQDYARISAYYLKNADAKSSLEEQVREEKVLDLIAAKAKVTEKDKSEIQKGSNPAA